MPKPGKHKVLLKKQKGTKTIPKQLTNKARLDRSHKRNYQFKICLWIALHKTTPQIIDLLQDRLNVKVTRQNIDKNYRNSKKWKPVINYIRKRYLDRISHIPISNKVNRLALLNEAAEEALTWRLKSKNQYGKIFEKKIGNVPQIVSEARKEVEGEKVAENHFHLTVEQKDNKIAKLRRYYSKAKHSANTR